MSQSPSPADLAELRQQLERTLRTLRAEVQSVESALGKIEQWESRATSDAETSLSSSSLRPISVERVADELQSAERLRTVLEQVEAETSLEHQGFLLAEADRTLARLSHLAHRVSAEEVFESLDALARVDARDLPRRFWLRKNPVQHRLLGVLCPGEEEPYLNPSPGNHFIDEMLYPARIFLLTEEGGVRVLDTELVEHVLAPLGQWSLEEGKFYPQVPDVYWASLRTPRGRQPREVEARDLVFTPRPDLRVEEGAESRHRLGPDTEQAQSVAQLLLENLERALQRAVQVRQEALRERTQAVVETRRTLNR